MNTKFEEKIISLYKDPLQKLYRPALKAFKNPKHGIKPLNPSVEFVIRDCARITTECFSLYAYSNIEFKKLKNFFTLKEIEDFIKLTQKNSLKTILLDKLIYDFYFKYYIHEVFEKQANEVKPPNLENNNKFDVYGGYLNDNGEISTEIYDVESKLNFADNHNEIKNELIKYLTKK